MTDVASSLAADHGEVKEAGGAKRDGLGAGEDDGGRATFAARDRSGSNQLCGSFSKTNA